MKKGLFIAATAFLLLNFVSCKETSNKSGNSTNWTGTYTGVIPSASQGINLKITLNSDETYTMESQYIGKSDSIFTNTGKFKRDAEKGIIIFEKEKEDSYSTYYKLGENTLTQLDLEGNVITGDFANDYVLKKQQK